MTTVIHPPRATQLLYSILLMVIPLLTAAQTKDSIVSKVISPGVRHTEYTLTGPFTLDVVEVDLRNPRVTIESFRTAGLVKTSEQARINGARGRRVLCAVNADFFSFKTGWPVGNQLINGLYVAGLESGRSHLLFNRTGRPFIERTSFRGWIKPGGGTLFPLSGINAPHENNSIILHTCYSDSATPMTGPGARFRLRLIDPAWSGGDTLRLVVAGQFQESDTLISDREAVIWIGAGNEVWELRQQLQTGDTVLAVLGFSHTLHSIANVLGGAGRILLNGIPVPDSLNVQEKISPSFIKSRHPRTFIAFNRDTTKLLICTVDGRQKTSVGMSFQEMADFLLSIGAWNAVNLDGGGSTTMVVQHRIVNAPSDANGERAVANTLQVLLRNVNDQNH